MKPKTLIFIEKGQLIFSDQGFDNAWSFWRYYVRQFPSDHKFYANKWTADLNALPLLSAPKGTPSIFETREEAQAAAQEDFNARVMSLLD